MRTIFRSPLLTSAACFLKPFVFCRLLHMFNCHFKIIILINYTSFPIASMIFFVFSSMISYSDIPFHLNTCTPCGRGWNIIHKWCTPSFCKNMFDKNLTQAGLSNQAVPSLQNDKRQYCDNHRLLVFRWLLRKASRIIRARQDRVPAWL